MAIIEVDDVLYNEAMMWRNVADKIGRGKNRVKLLNLVKEDFPDLAIPEVDAAKPLDDKYAALEKEFADFKAAAAQEKSEAKANRTIAAERQRLREAGWDDEGIEKIETYMRENSNPDYKSAAAYVQSQLPPEKPLTGTFQGQRFDWFTPPTDGADNHNLLMKNPRAFQDAEISKFLKEHGNRRRAWGS